MPVPPNPADVAQRWASRLGASTDKIRAGVQSQTVSPTQLAAAAGQKWLSRLNDPATLQKFQSRLQNVSLGDWQNATLNKGLPRISSGAAAAVDKFTNFMSQFLPFVESVAARVRQMPSTTLDDKINRAVAQIRGTAQFKRT